MNKLELKHIAPYLPYGLKVKTTNEVSKDKIHTPKFIDAELEMIYLKEIPFKINQPLRECHLPYIKPILRPMSDLYREIDGSVGIVELAKIAGCKDEEIKSYVLDGQTNYTIPYTFHVDGRVFKLRGEFFFSPKAKSFLFDYFDNGNESKSNFLGDETSYQFGVDNQLELFSYLFEHHFDVFGLIEKGLAIDKNIIE